MEEKKYWDNNFSCEANVVDLFAEWYEQIRSKLNNIKISLEHKCFILEIGVGNGYSLKYNKANLVIDYSFVAVKRIIGSKNRNCKGIVASAADLPIKPNVIKAIYTNDVLHHIKAQDKIEEVIKEIYRILIFKGYFCLSDRKPGILNYIILNLNKLFRNLFLYLKSKNNNTYKLLGSSEEPPMSNKDYNLIISSFKLVSYKTWKNIFVWLLCGISIYSALFFSKQKQFYFSNIIIKLCDFIEKISIDFLMTDVCIQLQKIENK